MEDDLGNVMNGVMWVQVVLAILFVGARIYTRHFLLHSLGWDDLSMLLNLMTFIGFVACTSVGIAYGVGKKTAFIPPTDYPKAVKWEVMGQGICILGIAASKASVALFLLRIVVLRIHKLLLWLCIVTTSLLCIVTTILLLVQCEPVAYLWDTSIKGGYCWLHFTPIGITTGAWSAAMDFALAILPWAVILNLNMKRKEKLTVLSGLSLGVFAGICSIIRTYELQTLSSKAEYVYDTAPMLLWSTTEILVTIICACVPVLRPLYIKIRHGGSRSASSSGGRRPSFPLNGWNIQRDIAGMPGSSAGGKGRSLKSSSTKQSRGYPGNGTELGAMQLAREMGSEESILRGQRASTQREDVDSGPGRIVRTREIVVTSSAV